MRHRDNALWVYPIALRISKITKSKGPERWKTAERFRENICRKWGTYGQKTWSWWLPKLKICAGANQVLLLKRLQNIFFGNRPLHGTNITQIFPFVKTTELHNIQPVPIVWNTFLYQPVKISVDSLAAVASFQLVPKYISKVKVISKYFTIFPIVQWRMWCHFLLLVDVMLLNLIHCYSGHVQVCKSVWRESFICSPCPIWGGICTW